MMDLADLRLWSSSHWVAWPRRWPHPTHISSTKSPAQSSGNREWCQVWFSLGRHQLHWCLLMVHPAPGLSWWSEGGPCQILPGCFGRTGPAQGSLLLHTPWRPATSIFKTSRSLSSSLLHSWSCFFSFSSLLLLLSMGLFTSLLHSMQEKGYVGK